MQKTITIAHAYTRYRIAPVYVMAAYSRGLLKKSHAGWLPVHQDRLRAQRSVTSMGELLKAKEIIL